VIELGNEVEWRATVDGEISNISRRGHHRSGIRIPSRRASTRHRGAMVANIPVSASRRPPPARGSVGAVFGVCPQRSRTCGGSGLPVAAGIKKNRQRAAVERRSNISAIGYWRAVIAKSALRRTRCGLGNPCKNATDFTSDVCPRLNRRGQTLCGCLVLGCEPGRRTVQIAGIYDRI